MAQASGGYALRVDYNLSAPVDDPATRLTGGRFAGRVAGVAPLEAAEAWCWARPAPPRRSRHGRRGHPGPGRPRPVPLDARAADCLGGDDRAIWRAVLADPAYVVLGQYLGQDGYIGASPTSRATP